MACFKIQDIDSTQKKLRYSCDRCEYQCTRKDYLKMHIQSVHDKIKYPCDLCEHKATKKENLKKHIQSVLHEKINLCPSKSCG